MARKAPREDPGEDGLEVSAPKDWAAGIPAVTHALRMGYDQMGVRRTALTLLKVNQKNGFDCPAAPGRRATTAARPSSARTAPRPWPRRPPSAG